MAVNRIEIEISADAEKARAGLREVSAEVVRATEFRKGLFLLARIVLF